MTAIIIGASASGLAAAIQLKRNIESAEVTVIERLRAKSFLQRETEDAT